MEEYSIEFARSNVRKNLRSAIRIHREWSDRSPVVLALRNKYVCYHLGRAESFADMLSVVGSTDSALLTWRRCKRVERLLGVWGV